MGERLQQVTVAFICGGRLLRSRGARSCPLGVKSRHQKLAAASQRSRDSPRLIFGQQFDADRPPRLVLEIEIGERLPAVVAHDEAGELFLDDPQRWEAAFCHGVLSHCYAHSALVGHSGGRRYALRRFHRYWLFAGMYAFGGSESSPPTQLIMEAAGSGVGAELWNFLTPFGAFL